MVIFLYSIALHVATVAMVDVATRSENRDIPNEITSHSLPRPSYH